MFDIEILLNVIIKSSKASNQDELCSPVSKHVYLLKAIFSQFSSLSEEYDNIICEQPKQDFWTLFQLQN